MVTHVFVHPIAYERKRFLPTGLYERIGSSNDRGQSTSAGRFVPGPPMLYLLDVGGETTPHDVSMSASYVCISDLSEADFLPEERGNAFKC
jgi:hypothetical protein